MKHIDKAGSSTFNVAIAPFSLSILGDDNDVVLWMQLAVELGIEQDGLACQEEHGMHTWNIVTGVVRMQRQLKTVTLFLNCCRC
jgi:hypothetical protein